MEQEKMSAHAIMVKIDRFYSDGKRSSEEISKAVASMEARAEKDSTVMVGTNFPDSWFGGEITS